MTNYIILVLCIIIILAYLFDISGKYSKIPGVIFLIALGIGIRYLTQFINFTMPDLKPLLPVIGTLGLIMIVMEASLDLKLERSKKKLIIRSIASGFILLCAFTGAFTWILIQFYGIPLRDSLLNSIPLGIISGSVAIPAAQFLESEDREFIIYESSFSDIFGIIIFDFILNAQGTVGHGISIIVVNSLVTIAIALLITGVLAFLLHKITYHVNYVIIMTCIILVYVLAKMAHLPALLLVLVFGLILSNNHLFRKAPIDNYIDFDKFGEDLKSFKIILSELTFLVRSIFFILFGFYIKTEGLFDLFNILTAAAITMGIFLLRFIFIKQVLRTKLIPVFFYSPRGLITILLFLSIPVISRIDFISEEVITLIVLFSIIILMIGSIFSGKGKSSIIPDPEIKI
jgi:hypothetical protein